MPAARAAPPASSPPLPQSGLSPLSLSWELSPPVICLFGGDVAGMEKRIRHLVSKRRPTMHSFRALTRATRSTGLGGSADLSGRLTFVTATDAPSHAPSKLLRMPT